MIGRSSVSEGLGDQEGKQFKLGQTLEAIKFLDARTRYTASYPRKRQELDHLAALHCRSVGSLQHDSSFASKTE